MIMIIIRMSIGRSIQIALDQKYTRYRLTHYLLLNVHGE